MIEKIKAESKNHLHRFWHAEIRTCFFCKYPIQEYVSKCEIGKFFEYFAVIWFRHRWHTQHFCRGRHVCRPQCGENCFAVEFHLLQVCVMFFLNKYLHKNLMRHLSKSYNKVCWLFFKSLYICHVAEFFKSRVLN